MRTLLLFFLFLFQWSLAAQDAIDSIDQKSYYTSKINNSTPTIDGRLNDLAWQSVEWGGDFIQQEPYEGNSPTQKTAFKIIYDDKYLYAAFRCYDTEPSKIVRRMSRRDGFEGDWVELNIDSYHDLRTAFSFTISVSGVKGDEYISNNGQNWDDSWNPIWYAKTQIDSLGWSAEIKIPFSQLRFGNKEEHVWGIQMTRRDFRKDERSIWQRIPRNAGVWVSKFGELRGLKGIKSQKQIEIQPYVLGQVESFEKEEGNPFATGFDKKVSAGVDGKIGVTSDLILDFTINPDFGQVEADPSVVTLDGFQIFFNEQRPFFIESINIFENLLTDSEAGGPFDSDLLFYSRRIGGSPHGYPDTDDDEYLSVPANTSILGAAKFSGKTKKGLSVGILESVTAQESASIEKDGIQRSETVEPLTSYFIARLQQDFDGGNTVIGGMFTATNRQLENTGLDYLHKSAYTSGLDFMHQWDNQSWFVAAKGTFSKVNGSTEAITQTQESFEHYFQRPDADHLEVDTTATSLMGHAGTFKIGKLGGDWKFETGLTWRSPGLELNDVGFLNNADEIHHFFWGGYRKNQPFGIFNNLRINYNHYSKWDFGKTNLYQSINTNWHTQFKNFWQMGTSLTYENLDIDNNALFGGPALRKPRGTGNFLYLSTDNRKKIRLNWNMFHAWGFEKTVRIQNYRMNIRFQPTNALNISVGPSFNRFRRPIQYVDKQSYHGTTRYIAGRVNQKTVSASIRLNYSVTPNLSIQYYGQPFISQIQFSEFKYITDPMAKSFADRHALYTGEQISYDEGKSIFSIDENKDGDADYSFDNPDFSFIQFRSNLVLRWEYTPGSELFLVWSQNNSNNGDPNQAIFRDLDENLFSRKAYNIFLLKYTYRFLL